MLSIKCLKEWWLIDCLIGAKILINISQNTILLQVHNAECAKINLNFANGLAVFTVDHYKYLYI